MDREMTAAEITGTYKNVTKIKNHDERISEAITECEKAFAAYRAAKGITVKNVHDLHST